MQRYSIAHRLSRRFYTAILRPVAHPLALRVRSFLLSEVRDEIAALRRGQGVGETGTRLSQAVEDALVTLLLRPQELRADLHAADLHANEHRDETSPVNGAQTMRELDALRPVAEASPEIAPRR